MPREVTGFERAVKLLQKRKGIYLVPRDLLQKLVNEMAEAARQVRNAERFVVQTPAGPLDVVADPSMPEDEIAMAAADGQRIAARFVDAGVPAAPPDPDEIRVPIRGEVRLQTSGYEIVIDDAEAQPEERDGSA